MNVSLFQICRAALGGIALVALASCSGMPKPREMLGKKEPEPLTVDFEREIRPFLEARCLACHHGGKAMRDVNLESLKIANTTWRGGPVIVPKHPERSVVVQILQLDIDRASGQPAHRVTFAERERLVTWIREGADWPGETPPLSPR